MPSTTTRLIQQCYCFDSADHGSSHMPRLSGMLPVSCQSCVRVHGDGHACMLQVVASTVKPIPGDVIPDANPNSPLSAEPTRRPHPLLCLPPVFSRTDATFPYHFKAYGRKSTQTDMQWAPKGKVPGITWGDPVPAMPSQDNSSLQRVRSIPCSVIAPCSVIVVGIAVTDPLECTRFAGS